MKKAFQKVPRTPPCRVRPLRRAPYTSIPLRPEDHNNITQGMLNYPMSSNSADGEHLENKEVLELHSSQNEVGAKDFLLS